MKGSSYKTYSTALKEETILYQSQNDKLRYRKIAEAMNMRHPLKGRRLAYNTMRNYVDKNKIGKSPEKRGPMATLPLSFLDLLNFHVSMFQLEGKAELKPCHLKTLIGAALMKTNYDHLNVGNFYNSFRMTYSATVCPTRMMEIKERCSL